ncbi:MAG TPA: hypothetical protein VIS71_12750 [Terrimicrobium sp.]
MISNHDKGAYVVHARIKGKGEPKFFEKTHPKISATRHPGMTGGAVPPTA